MAKQDYELSVKGDSGTGSCASDTAGDVGSLKSSGSQARASWGGKVEFILTCIGYAVGLGNVWRFPYLAFKNGGGAFLIPYAIMLFAVGIPLFFLEVSWAQFASLGPITIWHINPLLKGLGVSMVLTTLIIAIYYNVIIAWLLYYLFASMRSQLPWETCGNSWNTIYCMETHKYRNLSLSLAGDIDGNGTLNNGSLTTMAHNATVVIGNLTVKRSQLKSPSEEYFYRNVLQMSSDISESGTVVWELALCLLLAWVIVFLVLIKGISTLGKVVYFTSVFPYVLLTVMLVRGLTLEGAWLGLKFYLSPDWSRLADATVWSNAATQIFYSLGPCQGTLMIMASYNQFKNNTFRDSLIITLVNCGTSFYGGLVIFSLLGYMAHVKGVGVADVAASGPGLVFVVYPEGLTTLPIAPLWSILFFTMMLIIGLGSMFSMTECFFGSFIDEFPSILRSSNARSIIFRLASCVCFFLLELCMITNGGFYVFNLIDTYTGGFPLLVMGLIEIVAVMFVYGYANFAKDLEMMLGRKPFLYFRVSWCVLAPIIIVGVAVFMGIQYEKPTLFSGDDFYVYPDWAEGIGWLVVVICLGSIPAVFLYVFCTRGASEVLCQTSRPTPVWGPARSRDRTGRYATSPQDGESSDDVRRGDVTIELTATELQPKSQPPRSTEQVTLLDNCHGSRDKIQFIDDHKDVAAV